MSVHHVPEDALLAYATGNGSEAEALLVAAHATLCPQCRHTIEDFQAAGDALLESLPEAQLPPSMLDELLQSLLQPLPEPTPPPARRGRGVLPEAIAMHTGPYSEVAWTTVIPGVEMVELPVLHNGIPTRLFRLVPGLQIPIHSHSGVERLLVLTGAFTDEMGTFQRGDVSWRSDTGDHNQRILQGDPCVALLVADGLLVPRSPEAEAIAGLI